MRGVGCAGHGARCAAQISRCGKSHLWRGRRHTTAECTEAQVARKQCATVRVRAPVTATMEGASDEEPARPTDVSRARWQLAEPHECCHRAIAIRYLAVASAQGRQHTAQASWSQDRTVDATHTPPLNRGRRVVRSRLAGARHEHNVAVAVVIVGVPGAERVAEGVALCVAGAGVRKYARHAVVAAGGHRRSIEVACRAVVGAAACMLLPRCLRRCCAACSRMRQSWRGIQACECVASGSCGRV
jgi:hypothetical protein